MSLLDRIGKILKGAAPPKTTEPEKSAPPAPPSGTDAKPANSNAAPTTGLFGGAEAPTATAPPTAPKKESAPTTKGLFGGDADDQKASTASAPTEPKPAPDTKGLFGDAGVATELGSAVKSDGPSSTVPQPDAQARPEGILPVHPKVLMIVHNPPIPSEGNKRLTDIFKWHDPEKLARGYIDDLKKVSGGYLNYEIVERIDADLFPPKTDGFAYTADDYVEVVRGKRKAARSRLSRLPQATRAIRPAKPLQ